MKTLLVRLSGGFALFLLGVCAAGAVPLTFSFTDPTPVVGTVIPGEPAGIELEVGYVNQLLSMGADETVTLINPINDKSNTYATSGTDYVGSVSLTNAFKLDGDLSPGEPNPAFTLVGSGFDYVLAKYDGPQGGSVVWYLGGNSFELPETSFGLWENTAGEGFEISHWTGFTSVPDGSTTAVLLGIAMVGLGLAGRRFGSVRI